jgi:aminoglycoside 6'-N-acetyltransferase
MGIAGTGKKTIGEAIVQQDRSFKLAHHHSWIDPVLKLLGNDSSVWYSLDEKGWEALNQARDVILNTIARVCPTESNFVITYEMLANNPYHQDFFNKVYHTAKKRNATLIPVRLVCELDELLKRLQHSNRINK